MFVPDNKIFKQVKLLATLKYIHVKWSYRRYGRISYLEGYLQLLWHLEICIYIFHNFL